MYFKYLYSYEPLQQGRISYKNILKLLKLPWNIELIIYNKEKEILNKAILMQSIFNGKQKSIELSCNFS